MADYRLKSRMETKAHRKSQAPRPQADRTVAEMPEWIEKAGALPDIRWSKVEAVREALANGQYDVDARLADMFRDPPRELTILGQMHPSQD